VTVIEVDPYVLDTLMPDLVGHDRQPSAFLVYLLLWRLTHGSGAPATQVPLRDLAAGTGLSKRAVQEAVARLTKRRLIEVVREGITAVAVYTVLQPWRRR
jgi:DNA-binding GntR family transcriptional regulator